LLIDFEEFTEVMMGGYGSGRTSGSRDLTTSYRALDVIAEANYDAAQQNPEAGGLTRLSSEVRR
jgi:hypothetical protein